MVIQTGSKVQDLEKTIIANLKETELVEHPHFYHRNLRNPKEPLILSYKAVDVYRRELDSYDPLLDILQISKEIGDKPGISEIKTEYNAQTGVHTLQVRLDQSSVSDALDFKYNLLLTMDNLIREYLIETGKKPTEQEENYRNQISKVKKRFGKLPKIKNKKHKK